MHDAQPVGPAVEDLVVVELGAELSIYDSRSGQALFLNATAADIWRLADGTTTLDQVVEALARSYSTDARSIRPDVERAVADLEARRLLARPTA